MKKKMAALLMLFTLVLVMAVGCSSESEETSSDTTQEETEKTEESDGKVSAEDAVAAAQAGDTHVLDVREWENYVSGRVPNSEWCPIFPLEDETLAESMTEYADKNFGDNKDIYIICNSGAKGAEKATEVLTEAGIDPSRLFTVEGGAKALAELSGVLTTDRSEENIDWKYVSGEDAVAALGDEAVQFLDVRDDETYAAGHLEGSLQCNLKEIEDAQAQTKMYEMAAGEMDPEKPVYILCYSGNKCAKTAISVMKDAGFDTEQLFIIEDGAKNSTVSAEFVTE